MLRPLIKFLLIVFLCASTPFAMAQRVVKQKRCKIYIKGAGVFSKGEKVLLKKGSKTRGRAKIMAVKGNKAIGRVLRKRCKKNKYKGLAVVSRGSKGKRKRARRGRSSSPVVAQGSTAAFPVDIGLYMGATLWGPWELSGIKASFLNMQSGGFILDSYPFLFGGNTGWEDMLGVTASFLYSSTFINKLNVNEKTEGNITQTDVFVAGFGRYKYAAGTISTGLLVGYKALTQVIDYADLDATQPNFHADNNLATAFFLGGIEVGLVQTFNPTRELDIWLSYGYIIPMGDGQARRADKDGEEVVENEALLAEGSGNHIIAKAGWLLADVVRLKLGFEWTFFDFSYNLITESGVEPIPNQQNSVMLFYAGAGFVF